MRIYKLQMKIQDLIYTKYIRALVFRDFNIGKFTYSAIRFKWLAKVMQIATGCRHRFWKDACDDLTRHKLELEMEAK